jgi:MSHA biogenesis protein MshN
MTERGAAARQDRPAAPPAGYVVLRNTAPDRPQLSAPEAVAAERESRRAVSGARAVVKSAAEQPASQLDRARAAMERGDLAEAELLLTRHLERLPRDLAARELLIGLVLRGERSAEALPQLDLALALSPQRWPLHLLKARLLLDEGQVDEARSLLQSIPTGDAQRASALQMLGALEQQAGRALEAQAVYRELVALTPLSGPAWAGLAISLDSLGDDEAATAFGRGLKIGGLPEPAAVYARNRLRELGAVDE